jgi:MscS family membrane protein
MKLSKLLMIFCLVLLTTISYANKADLNLKNPHNTIYTHIASLHDEYFSLDRSASTLDFAGTKKEARNLAVKLRQIFDSKGLYIQMNRLPKDPNYKDSSGNHKYILFKELPELYVVKKGDQWLYSEESVDQIAKIHQSIFRFGTDRLLLLLPKAGSSKFLGLQIWQWLGIAFIIFVSALFYFLFRWLFGIGIYRIVKLIISPTLARTFIKPLAKPLSALLITLIIRLLIPILQLGPKATNVLFIIDTIFISLFFMIILYRMVDVLGAYMFKAAQKTESTMDDQLVPLVTKFMKIFVVIIGILFVLQNLKFNITALLAGISIGGIAFALAAQDTIKNLFGSLMIFLDKPFQIGDWIISHDVDGTVEEVGFRSTRVRTFQNSLISIPNGKLADMAIDNMGLRRYRRYKTDLTITYDTPAEKIESFVEGIRALIKTHPHTRKDYYIVQLNSFGSSSLNIMLYVFFSAENWQLELRYRHELIISILRLAEELEVRWAFPTETLFIEEMPGQVSLSPKHNTDKDVHRRKINNLISKIKRSQQQGGKHNQNKKPQAHEQKEVIPEKNPVQKTNKITERIKKPNEKPKAHHQDDSRKNQERIKQEEQAKKLKEKSIKKGKELTDFEIIDAASKYKLSVESLKAVIEVESKAKGFFEDGKPYITFHGQKFWKELEKKNMEPASQAEKYPDVVYQRWSRKFIRIGEKEYERLEKAKSIDKESAYLSTNWGMFQLSGQDFKKCGFSSVNEMVFNVYKTEKEQLEAFCKYLEQRKLLDDLRQENWKDFANKYNGPSNRKAKFDEKIEKAYQKYKANKS